MIEPAALRIVIISNDTILEKRLLSHVTSIQTPVTISTCDKNQSPAIEQADGIIFCAISDGEWQQEPAVQGRPRVLYCKEGQGLPAGQPIQKRFTALWTEPLSEEALGLQLALLVEDILEKKKAAINRVYLNTLIDSVPDLIWFKDLRGAHLKVNDAFCRAVGKSKQQCEGRGHYYIWDLEPDEYANGEYVCLETEEEVIEKGVTCLFDEKVKIKNSLHQFKTYKSPLFDAAGAMFGTVGIAKDVTDLQNISSELSLVLSSLPLATLVAGATDEIVFLNDKFCEYFAMSAEQVKAIAYDQLCKQLLELDPHELNQETMREISVNFGGVKRVLRVQQQPIKDIFGSHFGYFLLCLDVTNEHKLQQKIIQNANTDFLTGLYNRRYLYNLAEEKRQGDPICVAYFDLDNFKQVNDQYGHQTGDEVLVLMANTMKEVFGDELISRLGGDEFLVVDFNCRSVNALEQKVALFMERVKEISHENPVLHTFSVCAGIAYSNRKQHDLESLILSADKALYQAKTTGKARYVVYH